MYTKIQQSLLSHPQKWLITGVAGFIGSNLLEALLNLNQTVVGLDNFITGKKENLAAVKDAVSQKTWQKFHFVEGDICELNTCQKVCEGVDFVLHQAALGSVPRSLKDPLRTNEINVTGSLNVFLACRDQGVKRVVYASSSSVYGDEPKLPKQEDRVGQPLSPYALTKAVNEAYARIFAQAYQMEMIGLRYFNVFGKRQDPEGAYAAVIPRWISALMKNEPVIIYGDGETSRDFCYIDNVVQANILAATTTNPQAVNQVYNIAVNQRTSLNELYQFLSALLKDHITSFQPREPLYQDFRAGDVKHSLADISKASSFLGYSPCFGIKEGLARSFDYYAKLFL